MSIKIESGIPIPFVGGKYEEALRKMKAGDSFVAKESCRSHVRAEAKKIGCEIVCRHLENGEMRFWKVSKS